MISLEEKHKIRILTGIFAVCCFAFIALSLRSYYKIDKMASTLAGERLPVIVLDPGHGGEDGGAAGSTGILEKDINLAISLKLRRMLEISGFQVVMTRDTDISINDPDLPTIRERKVSDLHNRLKLIEEQGECIFLSIHQNHFTDGKYYGSQVFYSANNDQSKLMAESIRAEIIQLLQPENSREAKPASNSIYLLWNAKVPAVIVECGFLSNASEEKKLVDPKYQEQMAFAIYCGFLDYWKSQP